MRFQSTRPRGARPKHGKTHLEHHRFNPRARVGRDAAPERGASGDARFNPRARVGRDGCISIGYGAAEVFQSTRPRGARPPSSAIIRASLRFQSTRPRGARHCARWLREPPICFNPRARVGRDLQSRVGKLEAEQVSIHAPAWGATQPDCQANRRQRFQSTRPRGARPRKGKSET